MFIAESLSLESNSGLWNGSYPVCKRGELCLILIQHQRKSMDWPCLRVRIILINEPAEP